MAVSPTGTARLATCDLGKTSGWRRTCQTNCTVRRTILSDGPYWSDELYCQTDCAVRPVRHAVLSDGLSVRRTKLSDTLCCQTHCAVRWTVLSDVPYCQTDCTVRLTVLSDGLCCQLDCAVS